MYLGERRGSNPRIMEPQSNALPLGYARHISKYTISSLIRKVQNSNTSQGNFGNAKKTLN